MESLGGENALTESLAGGEAGTDVTTISAGVPEHGSQNAPLVNESSISSPTRDYKPVVQADGSRYLSGDFWTSLSCEVSSFFPVLP